MWGVGLLSVFKWWVAGFLVVCCADRNSMFVIQVFLCEHKFMSSWGFERLSTQVESGCVEDLT